MTRPLVQTVILNFRTPRMTLRAVEAAHAAMQGIAGEITVVDNGSGDGSDKVLAEALAARRGWDRVHLRLSPRNGGFGAGNNFAMAQGLSDGRRADYVYLLNSDAFPEPGAISGLVDFLETHPRAGMAGSFIRGEDGVPHETAFRFPSVAGEFEGAVRTGIVTRALKRAVVPLPIPKEATRVDWCAGASVLMRQDMLEAIGGFDETFFLYYEETDLCQRAKRAGWEVWYLPGSVVVHVGSASTGMKRWVRTPGYWFESRLHYFTKTHGRAYAALATAARIAGAALWRLRQPFSGRPLGDPPHFLRDLLAHSLRRLAGRRARAVPAPIPLTEDAK